MASTSFLRLLAVFLAISGEICQGRSIEETAGVRVDWMKRGQEELMAALRREPKIRSAKNVIFFIGDGLGVSTLAPTRFFKSQREGTHIADTKLSWEDMDYTGLIKTYTVNRQTGDSSGTATALLSGEKTRTGIVGLNQNVPRGNCTAAPGNELTSFIHHAMAEEKWAGIVTNTRITHATPAGAYAHSPDRYWEDDFEVRDGGVDPEECWDIARQLVWSPPNHNIRVILGGGRRHMMPNTTSDPEYPTKTGYRWDGRDLRQDWMDIHSNMSLQNGFYKYVEKKDDFDDVDTTQVEYLMGLFEHSHMKYEADREEEDGTGWSEPSLAEMVQKSLDILKRGPNGYVLFVESGRIDHAHHATNAYRAMTETLAMDEAVQLAMNQTSADDTLIVVTADHSHVFTMGGYQDINTDILGLIVQDGNLILADDGKPMSVLSYINGPGFYPHRTEGGDIEKIVPRLNPADLNTTAKDFLQDAGVPLGSETHGGEDVPVYARGPMAHLLIGQHEQSYLAHGIMYAQCIGPNKDLCENPPTTSPTPTCDTAPPALAGSIAATLVLVVLSILSSYSALYQ